MYSLCTYIYTHVFFLHINIILQVEILLLIGLVAAGIYLIFQSFWPTSASSHVFDNIKTYQSTRAVNLTAFHLDSPDVFNNLPDVFLPGYRNFCWNGSNGLQLQCLPRVYFAGMPKCGTTDLYRKLSWHPDVISTVKKENHYWTKERVGNLTRVSFLDYLNKVRAEEMTENSLLVDGSQSLLWNLRGWESRFPWADQPPYSNADMIYDVTPAAQILVLLRDPVLRLYSDYLYFGKESENRTAQSFNVETNEEVERFRACLEVKDLRLCCYDSDNSPIVRLNIGIYICYIRDWKERFGDNLMVIKLEDYHLSPVTEVMKMYEFLNLSLPDPRDLEAYIEMSPEKNTRHSWDVAKGDMMEETAVVLQEFYREFNRELSEYLRNPGLLYNYTLPN